MLCTVEKKDTIDFIKKEKTFSKNSNDNTADKENKEYEEEKYKYLMSCKTQESLVKYLKQHCPEFIEKFELSDYLKSGGFGSVVTAFPKIKNNSNKKKPKEIALKFLNLSGYSKEKKEIKHSEILIHGLLKHKNIPAIFGYYKIKENSCIAMDYCQYGDLENFKKKILKRNDISQTLLCYILGGLCEAVHYIHYHHKIIHMDIKQQNVLVDDYLNIKLTDFSVSISYKNKNKISLPKVGTSYYMSPEVLNKKTISAENASKIDVYSIGVLLYRLAFNDYPYKLREVETKNHAKIAKYIEENELEFPEDDLISNPFLNLLRHCLDKDITKRYNIFQLMKDPWYQGYNIILREKENLYNAGTFLIDLMMDNLWEFNEYVKNIDKNEI